MPSQVRIISRRNSPQWDDLVRETVRRGALRVEHDYYGITNPDRADTVRKCIRTAARHQGHGAKVYYRECETPGACPTGGPECRYHVKWTLYPLDEAREYKASQSQRP